MLFVTSRFWKTYDNLNVERSFRLGFGNCPELLIVCMFSLDCSEELIMIYMNHFRLFREASL